MSEAISVSPPNIIAIMEAIQDLALHGQNDISFNGSALYEYPLPQDMQGGKTPWLTVRIPQLVTYAAGGRPIGPEAARMSETVEPVWDFEVAAIWPHVPPHEIHYSEACQALVTFFVLFHRAYNLKGTCESCIVMPGLMRQYQMLDDSWWIDANFVIRCSESLDVQYSPDAPQDLSRSLVDDLLLEDSLTV